MQVKFHSFSVAKKLVLHSTYSDYSRRSCPTFMRLSRTGYQTAMSRSGNA
jgi:hypothetical protein